MVDAAIGYLEKRDDVEKTGYTKRDGDERITVEMWHDSDGLRSIFQKALDGIVSPRGLRDYAKEQAIAVRETRVSATRPAPDAITELLKATHHDDVGEYKRTDRNS